MWASSTASSDISFDFSSQRSFPQQPAPPPVEPGGVEEEVGVMGLMGGVLVRRRKLVGAREVVVECCGWGITAVKAHIVNGLLEL